MIAFISNRVFVATLFLPLFLTVAAAQTPQQQPVARLILSTNDGAFSTAGHSASDATTIETSGSTSIAFDDAVEAERRAFNVTNEVRLKNGLTALTWDPQLCHMAREHSEKMARRGFFSHLTPEGFGLRERARAAGVQRFKILGENIAYNQGFEDPGAFAVERWLTSSQHRANILSREFSASAVGTYVAADGRVYFTQVFILR